MHRLAARTITAVSLAGLLAGAALPAQAKSPHSEQRGGKKPVGEVVSFDAATSTLVLELAAGEALTAGVDPDAKVKLEHRGSHRRSKGHGNPSKGSLEDLLAGALVLRMKMEDDAITKIRLRPAPAETPPALPSDEDEDDDDSDEDDSTEDQAPDATGDPLDDVEDDDATDEDEDQDEDSDTPDDEGGDAEDAIPPLPVPLP